METEFGRRAAAVIAAGVTLGVGVVVGYAAVSGDSRFSETGDAFPGHITAAATPVGFYLGALLGALVLGGLAYVVVCARPDDDGRIGVEVYRAHRVVERASVALTVLSTVMAVVTAADRSGVSVSVLLTNPNTISLIGATELAVAWIVIAVCALALAVCTRFSLSWVGHALLLVPASVAAVALGVAGNAGQGPNHDYTTGAVLVAASALSASVGIKVNATLTLARDTPTADRTTVSRRIVRICLALDSVVVVYGVILIAFLVPADALGSTAYGRAAVIAAGAVTVGLLIDVVARRRLAQGRPAGHTARSLLVGALLGVAALAAVAVMATRTAPRLLSHGFTAWDVFLGYRLTAPPSPSSLATTWRLDLFLGAAAIALATAYLVAAIRLRRNGIDWPTGRTVSWVIGCAMLLIVTSSGVRAYGMAMFSIHMAEHMLLNMFIPVLLVLGAPVTLALRVLPTAPRGALPGPREWIVRLVHSRFTRLLCNPIVALVIFVVSLYGVYFTSVFDALDRYHWGHDLMGVHFLVTGYLFYWVIIGIDPGPRRLPYLGRLGLLFAIMPFHAFFGIATMTMETVIGGNFYRYLRLPWLPDLSDLLHDQFVGGAIAWGASEVPAVIVIIALVTQWARQDRRQARQADRRDEVYHDDELQAYNRMLAELSRGRN